MASPSIIVRHAESAEIAWILNCIEARASEAKLQVAGEGKYRHGWMTSKTDLDAAILNHEILVAQKNSENVGFIWFRKTNQYPFGVGYGEWLCPLYWIQDGYTTVPHRRSGVCKALHTKVAEIARENHVTDISGHMLFEHGPDLEICEKLGYSLKTVVSFQSTDEFLGKQKYWNDRYADKWQNWSARPANDSDVDWILRGVIDIYDVEQREPREDYSPEVEIIKDLITRNYIIVAVDGDSQRLGFLAFSMAESFPYGCELYGPWYQKFIWALYVWVDSTQRGSGIASYMYGKLFERAKSEGLPEIGLDVFNVNSTSRKFHENAMGFHPEVQVYIKTLVSTSSA